MSFSISKAWEESQAFVRREGQLLFPVAFFFLALPAVVLQQMVPADLGNVRPQTPEEFRAFFAALQPLLPALLLVVLIATAGSLTLFALMLKAGISVAEALNLGVRRLPVLIGAGLIVSVGMMLGVLALTIVLTLLAFLVGPEAVSLLVVSVILVVSFFIGVRLILMTAVVIGESGGMVDSIRRSWRLTRGHFWRLLGFALVFVLVGQIVQAAMQAIFGTIAGLVGGPSMALLFGSLAAATIATIWQVYFLTMVSRIYLQLGDAA